MEKRINKKFEAYFSEFKDNIKDKASSTGLLDDPKLSTLVQYIFDYERFCLTKEDFMKRRRVKNVVHMTDRCCAKKANGERCTRRRKDTEFCGTHLKERPHGMCTNDGEKKLTGQQIEVWAQDIKGIVYYIDKTGNVYQAEDVIQGKTNPKIIAKYVKTNDVYSIPEFNI
jgi:hypothetical protein